MPFHTARRRYAAATAAAAAAAALAPAGADARIVELGETATQPEPSCPADPCLAVSRTTGYQNRVGADEDLFVVPVKAGRIVAWTIILGDPTRKQTDFFNTTLGGEPSAGITVLEKVERKSTLQEVTAVSPIRQLTDYLGHRVQFPLARSLPVERGQRVALTVPTWAPALAAGFDGKTNWRASRPKDGCDDTSTQTAMTAVGGQRRFQCFYKTARLTYSVTIVTEPKTAAERNKRKKTPPGD
jgi:hypothetical protein